jgi:holo-[acyl-carrier protein] synthase
VRDNSGTATTLKYYSIACGADIHKRKAGEFDLIFFYIYNWQKNLQEDLAMVQGIGIDIVKLERIEQSINLSGKVFLDKVFTQWEQERGQTHPRPTAYFALTFAGKEAIFKLFHIGWETGVKLTEIEIKDGPHGEPIPTLSGNFARIAKERGITSVLISLSYEDEYAVAVATMQ